MAGLLLGCATPQAGGNGPIDVDGDCAAAVELHGGRPVDKPVIVNVYWGRYWDTPLPTDNAFLPAGAIPRQTWDKAWAELATSRAFWALLDEYQVGRGSWGGSTTLAEEDEDEQPLAEERIQATLEREIAAGVLADRADAIYVVYLAPGLTAAADYAAFGGDLRSAHHGIYRGASGAQRVYAVIEPWNASMGGHSIAATHEIAEAATDPDVKTGYWDSVTGAEIADMCAGSDVLLASEASPAADFFMRVHKVWSQRSCGCSGSTSRKVLY